MNFRKIKILHCIICLSFPLFAQSQLNDWRKKTFDVIMDKVIFYGGPHGDIGFHRIVNATINYQLAYNSSSTTHSFDVNGHFLLLNGGYTYQQAIGSKAYIGLGLGDLFNVQYGYAFSSNNHLLRIRSDCDIFSLFDKKKLYLLYLGCFAEKSFGSNSKGYYLGITMGISIYAPIIWIKQL